MIRRFKSAIIVLTCVLFCFKLNAQWTKVNTSIRSNLNSVCLLTETSGWIVGNNGTMLFLDENGWDEYHKPIAEHLNSVTLISEGYGWAVGNRGTILRLNGANWAQVNSPTTNNLYSVFFSSPDHGIAVGEHGTILIYERGSWMLQDVFTKGALYSAVNWSDITVIAGGRENITVPVYYKTDNKNHNFQEFFNPGYLILNSVAFQDNSNIWAVGVGGAIFHFNGNNWERHKRLGKLPTLNSVSFKSNSEGIVVGHSGIILTFTPTGEWEKESSPVKVRLNSASIAGSTYCAVGNNGTILTSKKITTSTLKDAMPGRVAGELMTYPNPTSETLNVILPSQYNFSNSTVSIIDLKGKVVYRSKMPALKEEGKFGIDISGLRSGLYLVQIDSSDGKTISGRFVVKR